MERLYESETKADSLVNGNVEGCSEAVLEYLHANSI